jgi:hypothetical protein
MIYTISVSTSKIIQSVPVTKASHLMLFRITAFVMRTVKKKTHIYAVWIKHRIFVVGS